MRFQCRIGDGVASMPLPTTTRATPAHAALAAEPVPPRAARRGWARQSAVAAGAVIAVAGCATGTLPGAAAPAKSYKIAPVYNVTNAGSNAESYFALGQYHEEARAWDPASEAYRKAVAFDAKHVESWNALGVTLARAGRYAEAEAAMREAVGLAPARPHLRNNLGYVLLLAGKPAEAVAVLEPVTRGPGASSVAQANLREALARVAAASGSAGPATEPTAVVAVPPGAAPLPGPPTVTAAVSPMRVGYAADAPAPQAVAPDVAAAPTPAAASTLRAALPAPRLEITNGNGVTGMASQLGRWLDRQGMPIARLSNQQPFVQRVTIVQYRSGHEALALRVAHALPANVKAEPAATPGLRGDVRVLLGRDWVQAAACLGRDTCQPGATAVAAVRP